MGALASISSKAKNIDNNNQGTENIAEVASQFDAVFFDYVIKKEQNVRAGTVTACHDGTNVSFTETSTQDLGDTSQVNLSVVLSNNKMVLQATHPNSGWNVSTLIRTLSGTIPNQVLNFSVVSLWYRSSGNYYDNGDHKIYLKNDPNEQISTSIKGGTAQLIHHQADPTHQAKFPACIVDVELEVGPSGNVVTSNVGNFKASPSPNRINNTRPARTEQYYVDLIKPHLPL